MQESGIPFVEPSAGMFLWLDLRTLLPTNISGADGLVGGIHQRKKLASLSSPQHIGTCNDHRVTAGTAGWDAERKLVHELFSLGVLFTPGEACHASEPGWFRCCFGAVPRGAAVEGLTRLARFAHDRRSTLAPGSLLEGH